MQKCNYIVFNAQKQLFQCCNAIILKSYPFISACIISTFDCYESVIKKHCTKFEKLNSKNKIQTQINKAKQFINVRNFYNQNLFGKGVCVAVIDTGVESVLDLTVPNNRILAFKDFTLKSNYYCYDDNGHGTFVAGIIGGNGLLSCGQYSGVAPECNVVCLKALNQKGEGTTEDILSAMQWIVENKNKYNIKVVCMSFGSEPQKKDALSEGANALWNSGLVVVTASGNNGPNYGTITSPGISSDVITVGALDGLNGSLRVADYSSRGDRSAKFVKPNILAPGTSVVSLSNKVGKQNYTVMSGTSVATPIIAGVCAILCQKYPFCNPEQIKAHLYNYAVDIGANKFAQGRGVFIYK